MLRCSTCSQKRESTKPRLQNCSFRARPEARRSLTFSTPSLSPWTSRRTQRSTCSFSWWSLWIWRCLLLQACPSPTPPVSARRDRRGRTLHHSTFPWQARPWSLRFSRHPWLAPLASSRTKRKNPRRPGPSPSPWASISPAAWGSASKWPLAQGMARPSSGLWPSDWSQSARMASSDRRRTRASKVSRPSPWDQASSPLWGQALALALAPALRLPSAPASLLASLLALGLALGPALLQPLGPA
mmetsp:Transcript_16578/g.63017  ORF Transcript_16578/g.63017 Transcript_16578/m.63017 type:complete len:243 (-) Transcript_16578:1529-2257(-)